MKTIPTAIIITLKTDFMKVNRLAVSQAHQNLGGLIMARLHQSRMLVADIICSLLVLLFSYTAISKLLVYDTFVRQLSKSPYVEEYASTIAWLLPAAECILALMLMVKATRLMALFAGFGLMLFFTAYIYAMLHYSFYIPCSCGGVLAKMTWTQHFWFNVAFTVLSLTGIVLTITSRKDINHKSIQP
jgi:hypothetical protein